MIIYTNLLSTRLTKYTKVTSAIKGAILQAIPEDALRGSF
jgi:hypothetical protein